MSIDKATTPISEYIGDGLASTFGMVFPAGSSSELLIYLRYVGTDAVIAYDLPGNDTELYPMQPLTEGVDYTLSNLNIPSVYGSLSLIDAGQLWITLGKLATDWNLIIRYDLDVFQSSSFRDLGVHAPINFEKALDRLTMGIKGMKYRMFDAVLATEVIDTQGKGIKIWAVGANYFVGDFLVLGDDLYRCLADHVAGATFAGDAAYWNMLLDETMDAKDDAQSIALGLVMDAKDDDQTIVLEGTMDTKDAAQSVVLEASMTTKDNIVRGEFAAADTIIQDAVDAIEVKTDNITVTQPVNLDEMEAAIAGGGSGTISEWTTGILYAVDAIIWEGEDFYRCILQHTSGATFAGDAANWNQMSDKLTATEVKASYESNADTNAYTDAEKSKVALLESSRYLGSYIDLPALELAHATANDGEYANVDAGLGNDVVRYLWDSSDSKWVLGAGSVLTDAEIKVAYENNLDTNAFTDAEKTKLTDLAVDADLVHNGGEATGALTLGTIADTLTTFIRNNSPVAWIGTVAQGWLFGIKTVHQGGIDADNKVVENIPTPTITHHATNKEYVDGKVQPLLDINTDSNEPSGFVRDTPDVMGIIELSPDGTLIHRIDQNGTYSQNSTGVFYDGSTALARQVRVSPVTGQDLVVYVNGVRHLMASQVVDFAAVSGLKYVYYSLAGVLTGSTVFSYDYFDGTPIVAIAYGNATTGDLVLLGDERHGITMDGFTHRYLHTTEGARYGGGMNIAALAAGVTVHGAIGAGSIYDEDIFNELPTQTNLPFWHIEGTAWNIISDTNLLGYINGVDTYISFNEDVAGVYQLTEITGSNEATIMYIVATNSAQFPYIKIIGQHKYDKVSDAQNAIGTELAELNTDLLPTPEFVFVGAIIINRSGELQLLDDGSTFLDLRTVKIPAQGGLSDAIVDHRTVTFREEPGAHPASAISFDPTISGIDPLIITAQAAIDKALVSGGVGDVSTYFLIDGDSINVTDWDRTSLVNATLTLNEVTPLSGDADYKFTTTATSTGETAHYDFDVSQRAQDRRDHIFKLPYRFNGTKDYVSLELFDQTNDPTNLKAIKTIFADPNEISGGSLFTMPVDCTQIRVKLTSITGEVSVLQFDQISFSDEGVDYGKSTTIETITMTGFQATASDNIHCINEFANTSDILLSLDNATYTKYTFLKACAFEAFVSMDDTVSATLSVRLYDKNDTLILGSKDLTSSGGYAASSLKARAQAGCYVVVNEPSADNTTQIYNSFSVTATAQSETANIEGNREQGHKKGKAIYTLSSSYSTTSTSYVLPAMSLTSSSLSGSLIQNTANAPSVTIPNAKIGTYTCVVTGYMGSNVNAKYSYALYDGTNYFSSQAKQEGYNSSLTFIYENLTEGGINLDFVMKTSGSANNIDSTENLELSFSYEPPVEEASVKTLYSLPVSKENDLSAHVDGITGALSRFSNINNWCTFVSKTTGTYTFALNQEIFSEFPELTVTSTQYNRVPSVVEGVFPNFTCDFESNAGALADTNFRINVIKAGADYTPPGVLAGDVPKERVMFVNVADPATAFYEAVSSSTSYKVRNLHSLDGDIFGSIATDELTLPVGKYVFSTTLGAIYGTGATDVSFGLNDGVSYIKEFVRVAYSATSGNKDNGVISFTKEFTDVTTITFNTKSNSSLGSETIRRIEIRKLS